MEKMIITGGSGFLGRALAKKFRNKFEVFLGGRNVMLGRAAEAETGCAFVPFDICSRSAVLRVFSDLSPHVVIHAAASKFVDTDELFPSYCCETNIQGSVNIIDAIKIYKVERVVAISTDKAASPSNSIYGASKLVMEQLFEKSFRSNSSVRAVTIRLGNIAWSSGSVLPIWREMIQTTGVIRSTGYEMKRFMMGVEDVASLVDLALAQSKDYSSEVLIPYMKWLKISKLLDRFLLQYRGSFERVPSRVGEANTESLLSPAEVAFARSTNLGIWQVYALTRGRKPLEDAVVGNVCDIEHYDELRDEEIDRLIRAG
jgi:UDP-N-acetylglucosamine 4,6-dehydratase